MRCSDVTALWPSSPSAVLHENVNRPRGCVAKAHSLLYPTIIRLIFIALCCHQHIAQ